MKKVELEINDPIARDALLVYSESLLRAGKHAEHEQLIDAISKQQAEEGCTIDE